MKQLKLFLTWPIIFIATWYLFDFQIAIIIGLAYLHIMTILLIYTIEKHQKMLMKIVQHINEKNGLVNTSKTDFENIITSDDAMAAIKK